MDQVTIRRDGRVVIRRTPFRPSDRLEVFTTPDLIVLKRLQRPRRLSDIARRAPGRPMPLRDIVRAVHAVRRRTSRPSTPFASMAKEEPS